MTASAFADIQDLLLLGPEGDESAVSAVRARDAQLTKPSGSLGEMEKLVAGIAGDISAHVSDPNAKFMASIDVHTFHTTSARGVKRVVGQVGADPVLGPRVEAKRGPLARATREGRRADSGARARAVRVANWRFYGAGHVPALFVSSRAMRGSGEVSSS